MYTMLMVHFHSTPQKLTDMLRPVEKLTQARRKRMNELVDAVNSKLVRASQSFIVSGNPAN